MPLIFSTDYDNLPSDPILRWLKLRDLVEKRLLNVLDQNDGASDRDLIEYCSILSSAADELGVGKLEPVLTTNVRLEYEGFRSSVTELATRLSLRASTSNIALSVGLSRPTKAKIVLQIERLRKLITESELPKDQKRKLGNKLDDLQSLVNAPRTDFAKVLAAIAYLALGVGGTTAFLADAPPALVTITALIGEDKEAEEEELRLLEMNNKPLELPDLRLTPSVDDEIPF